MPSKLYANIKQRASKGAPLLPNANVDAILVPTNKLEQLNYLSLHESTAKPIVLRDIDSFTQPLSSRGLHANSLYTPAALTAANAANAASTPAPLSSLTLGTIPSTISTPTPTTTPDAGTDLTTSHAADWSAESTATATAELNTLSTIDSTAALSANSTAISTPNLGSCSCSISGSDSSTAHVTVQTVDQVAEDADTLDAQFISLATDYSASITASTLSEATNVSSSTLSSTLKQVESQANLDTDTQPKAENNAQALTNAQTPN